MELIEPLLPGCFYHVYNRGIDGTTIFLTPGHYRFFLQQYAHHVAPVVDTYAYCLMRNHFHLMVRIKEDHELDQVKADRKWQKPPDASRQFAHLFNSYAQHYNGQIKRTGSLFERPFHRKAILSDQYYTRLIFYIHSNPIKHGITQDLTVYPHSSYRSHLSAKPTLLMRDAVLAWFGGKPEYIRFHQEMLNEDFGGLFTNPVSGRRP